MLRVYIGCFGSGLGHATRMLEVADALSRQGSTVKFSSSGEVAKMIEGRGYRCSHLPLADVRYSSDGSFSLRETMMASPLIIARTARQVQLETANITSFRPDVILSDSALPTVVAARIARLPVFTVLNQLSLTSSNGRRSAPVRLLSVGISAAMGKLWELSDEVLLPDLPPPYTISERNLWGSGVSKTRYIGFLQRSDMGVPDEVTRQFAADKRRRVFWQVSGPPGTRRPFLEKGLEVSRALADRYVFVVSGGDPRGNQEAERIEGGWYYGWCPSPEQYFENCDLVVSRAGHGTISQAILASKPSLLVPIPRQPEQEGNAMKAERLGVSRFVKQAQLTASSAGEALDSLGDGPAAGNAKSLAAYAARFNAVEDVVRTLGSAAL